MRSASSTLSPMSLTHGHDHVIMSQMMADVPKRISKPQKHAAAEDTDIAKPDGKYVGSKPAVCRG